MDSPTLLCIDRDLEIRKNTLEPGGYRVKVASSSQTAMKMLEESSVTAVLLEYGHEDMDSEAIACHIKERFPNLPIILLSAYSEMSERILWLVDDYVMKSELPERLVPIIERAHKLALRPNERLQRRGQTHSLDLEPDSPCRYALFQRCSFVSSAALVARNDHFRSRDRPDLSF